jgi:hypothetical protein
MAEETEDCSDEALLGAELTSELAAELAMLERRLEELAATEEGRSPFVQLENKRQRRTTDNESKFLCFI